MEKSLAKGNRLFGGPLQSNPPESNLLTLLEKSASTFPNRIAIRSAQQKISYQQLYSSVCHFASYLKEEIGSPEKEKICLFTHNSPLFVVSFFAILMNRSTVVPINTFLKEKELEHILQDCQAKTILVSKELAPKIESIKKNCKALTKVMILDEVPLNGCSQKNKAISSQVVGSDLAVLIYTSGTTGKPKGVMLSHANFITNVQGCLEVLNFKPTDCFSLILPLFHSFSLTVLMLLPLSVGAKIVIFPSLKNFKHVLKSFFIDRVTIFAGIPQIYDALAQKKLPFILRLFLKIKYCISGAAPLYEETLKKFEKNWRLPLLEGYGLSEASPVVSISPPKGARKVNSVGLPLPNVKVKILAEKGQPVPSGEKGEICVQGPNVMQGYFNQKQATAEVLKQGWLHTGDIGYLDPEGYLYITDRKKELILVRGMNVYPREIEEVLLKHPTVKEVAVVGVKDLKRGELPQAHVVLTEKAQSNEKELKSWCQSQLAHYKVPHAIIFHSSLPKTPTGKVQKNLLKS